MSRIDRLIDALNMASRHASQVSTVFLRGMAARMAVSYEKYGDLRDAYPEKLDALACSRLRVDKYLATGNTEYLMDAANFLMIEFMRPRHGQAHFTATDSDASPGRVDLAGRNIGAEANTTAHENIRRGGSSLHTAGGFYARAGD